MDNKDTKDPTGTQPSAAHDTFTDDRIAQASRKSIRAREHGLVLCIVIVLLLMAGLAVAGFLFIKPQPDTVQGQCDASEVRVSGKLAGRVTTIYVTEGQHVKAGDTLVRIHSTLADARLEQAQAGVSVAEAGKQRVEAGTRQQVIDAAYDVYQQSVAATGIAQKTFERMDNLFKEGVVSEQKRDEAKAAFEVAKSGEAAAKSQWELAKAGAEKADKAASAAMVRVAKGSVKEVNALLQDQYLTAPCDGEVTVIYPQESELIALGAPIMTIEKDDHFAVFNLRENMLKDITTGSKIKVYIPALDRHTEMEVYYIRDMGSYANWQATKATGDYDARTFTVKARPKQPIPNFRPGMSVILEK